VKAPDKKAVEKGAKLVWSQSSKVLAAIGAFIATITALLTALNSATWLQKATPMPAPTPVIVAAASAIVPTPALTLTVAPEAQPTPAVVATPVEGALLVEDFGDASSGWDIEATEDWEVGYIDGEYRIIVRAPVLAVWGNPPSAYEFDDIVAEVDARQVKGSVDHFYGLVIRDRPEGGGYLFAVSDDGYYTVQILRGDTWEDLVTWAESPALLQGGQINHLRVESLGPRMRFYANGKLLIEVTDDTYPSGTIGLLAGTSEDEGEVEARFDNLRVQVVRKL